MYTENVEDMTQKPQKDERGATPVEYIVFLALIMIAAIAAIGLIGYQKNSMSPEPSASPAPSPGATEAPNVPQATNSPSTGGGATPSSVTTPSPSRTVDRLDTVKVNLSAEYYGTELFRSAVGLTVSPQESVPRKTIRELGFLFLGEKVPPTYAQNANVNLAGASGWTCADSGTTPPRVTCAGSTPLAEGKKSVFTFFFNVILSPIPSSLQVDLHYDGGTVRTTVPIAAPRSPTPAGVEPPHRGPPDSG